MGHKGARRGGPGKDSPEGGSASKRGQMRSPALPVPVVEELDLHGMAIDEAMVQVELALARWRGRPGACIRVIHGQSSGSKVSIKGTLRRNLGSTWKGRIRAFRQEPANPGATLVFVAP